MKLHELYDQGKVPFFCDASLLEVFAHVLLCEIVYEGDDWYSLDDQDVYRKGKAATFSRIIVVDDAEQYKRDYYDWYYAKAPGLREQDIESGLLHERYSKLPRREI